MVLSYIDSIALQSGLTLTRKAEDVPVKMYDAVILFMVYILENPCMCAPGYKFHQQDNKLWYVKKKELYTVMKMNV